MYNVKGSVLQFGNGEEVCFEYAIKEVLNVHDILIVLIEPPPKTIFNQNVFAFSQGGDYLWQIKPTKHFYDGKNCPYIGLTNIGDCLVTITNWCDTAVIINVLTGEIVDKKPVR